MTRVRIELPGKGEPEGPSSRGVAADRRPERAPPPPSSEAEYTFIEAELDRANAKLREAEEENAALLADNDRLAREVEEMKGLYDEALSNTEVLAEQLNASVPNGHTEQATEAVETLRAELNAAHDSVGKLLASKLELEQKCRGYEEQLSRGRKGLAGFITRRGDTSR